MSPRVLTPFLLALSACGGGGGGDSPPPVTTSPAEPQLSAAASLGKTLFADTTLSASGQQACITCHVPSRAFTGDPSTDHGLPVPLGGRNMDLPGFRNAPSLVYASITPPFSIAGDGTPSGGFFRDGRASSLATQAQQPFTTAFEMANADAAETIGRLQASPSLAQFVAVYGQAVLSDPTTALARMGDAIAAYETEDPEFHPFTSKFDYYQSGQAQLTAQELRGFAVFNNPAKGNCTACHPSQVGEFSQHPMFTDFTYDNIGVPRNWQIAANAVNPVSPISGAPLTYLPTETGLVPTDSEYPYYDLGLCGPFDPAAFDTAARPPLEHTHSLCGNFKVPTLRNIAITAPYFHNGVFQTLQQVVEFYVTRDINNNTGNNPFPVPSGNPGNPYQTVGTFYTAADGTPDLFEYNDLPVDFDAGVNFGEPPYTPPAFGGGSSPTINASEIADLIAFLCTLTDGYDPANPSAYNIPAQCAAPVVTVN